MPGSHEDERVVLHRVGSGVEALTEEWTKERRVSPDTSRSGTSVNLSNGGFGLRGSQVCDGEQFLPVPPPSEAGTLQRTCAIRAQKG